MPGLSNYNYYWIESEPSSSYSTNIYKYIYIYIYKLRQLKTLRKFNQLESDVNVLQINHNVGGYNSIDVGNMDWALSTAVKTSSIIKIIMIRQKIEISLQNFWKNISTK